MPQKNVKLGEGEQIFDPDPVKLQGSTIGHVTRVGTLVEIKRTPPSAARCKISSHTFICVTIEDEVTSATVVVFTNDRVPRATASGGALQTEKHWAAIPNAVKKGASIGSGATILCGLTIDERALVGAGAVVTKDLPADAIVAGQPSPSATSES